MKKKLKKKVNKMHKYKTNLVAKASVLDCNKLDFDGKINGQKDVDATHVDPVRDLMKMVSILVSTGMNKNDDVFLRDEVLPARNSGANKPVNIEHDENKIIGNMVRTFVVDKNGREISEDSIPEQVPEDFDIANEAVIYKFLFPEVAEQIKSRANSGALFVSIEAWFSDYDFLVGSSVVKRNEQTSPILEPVLRINGGEGTFKGQRVGRVLRDILIGGIGVVEHPANPDSVIKSISSLRGNYVNKVEDKVLCNYILRDIDEEGDGEMDKFVAEMKELVKATQSQLKDQEKKNTELQTRVGELEREKLQSVRAKELKDLGFDDEFISTELDRAVAMSKDDFEVYKNFLVKIVNGLSPQDAIEQVKSEMGEEEKKEEESREAEEGEREKEEDTKKEEKAEATTIDEKENVEINIKPKDREFVAESDDEGGDSSQFEKILSGFLSRKNPRWNMLKRQ